MPDYNLCTGKLGTGLYLGVCVCAGRGGETDEGRGYRGSPQVNCCSQ